MNMTVYKYPLLITDSQIIQMPADSEIIHVGLDPEGNPCVWARVDTERALVPVKFYVTGTGRAAPDFFSRHLASLVQNEFVWHVWKPLA